MNVGIESDKFNSKFKIVYSSVTTNRIKKYNERIKEHYEHINKELLSRKRNDSVTCKQMHRIKR